MEHETPLMYPEPFPADGVAKHGWCVCECGRLGFVRLHEPRRMDGNLLYQCPEHWQDWQGGWRDK